MRQIKLLIDHHTPEGTIPAGSVIKVDKKTYDWLMGVYAELRTKDAARLKELELMYPTKDTK